MHDSVEAAIINPFVGAMSFMLLYSMNRGRFIMYYSKGKLYLYRID